MSGPLEVRRRSSRPRAQRRCPQMPSMCCFYQGMRPAYEPSFLEARKIPHQIHAECMGPRSMHSAEVTTVITREKARGCIPQKSGVFTLSVQFSPAELT
jgi:hypothetical protein